MSQLIQALVVDDQPTIRRRIARLLKKETDVRIVGECGDGWEAVASIQENEPDLVFLDVTMPGPNGFDVIQRIGTERGPVLVFVTGHPEFALPAFDIAAADFLIKSIDEERFYTALNRARAQCRLRRLQEDIKLSAIRHSDEQLPVDHYPEMLAVKARDRSLVVETRDINWVKAEGDYARLHVGTTSYLVGKTLTDLERNVLDPAFFLRIHRSTIVNLSRIASVEPSLGEELYVTLNDGTKRTCSRGHRRELRKRICFLG